MKKYMSVFLTLFLIGCAGQTRQVETAEPVTIPGIELRTLADFEPPYFYMGMPDDSAIGDDIKHLTNRGYAAGYSETKKNPLWVAYRLFKTEGESYPRLQRFLVDKRTSSRINHDHYTGSGYDRGHMAPSAGIGRRYGQDAQNETYLMSNITPQLPTLNQETWEAFEKLVSETYAQNFGEVWVVTGSIFDPDYITEICKGVEIPEAFYKIVVRERDGKPLMLAVVMEQDVTDERVLNTLVKNVDWVEEATGLDFFWQLPDDIEEQVESAEADSGWDLEQTLVPSFTARPRERCEIGARPRP